MTEAEFFFTCLSAQGIQDPNVPLPHIQGVTDAE